MPEAQFDVITIGAGGGAYPAAFRLARANLRVLMIDPKDGLGGNCLAEGCIPSKAIREAVAHHVRHKHLTGQDAPVDYAKILAHKDAVQNTRYAQHDRELAAHPGISILKDRAAFVDPYTLTLESDRNTRLKGKQIIIASGNEIVSPRIPGIDLALTSHDLYSRNAALTAPPATMIIIGGGAVGLETATFFAGLGTQVTVLQRGERLLPGMDATLVATLLPLLDPSIRIITSAEVERLERDADGVTVHYRHHDTQKNVVAAVAMAAMGRAPAIPEGFATLDIPFSRRGIEVTAAMQTALPHIYACGDINGRAPVFHAAARESLVAAHNILGGDAPLDYMDYVAVPTTLYTLPAAAQVGVTEAAAGATLVETAYDFAHDARAQIFGETAGGIHLFFEPGSMRLRGGWVVGIDADALIGIIDQAIAGGLSVYELAHMAHQHPTAAEGIGHAARALL